MFKTHLGPSSHRPSRRIWLLFCNSLTLEKVPPLKSMFGVKTTLGGTYTLKDPTRAEEVKKEVEADTEDFMCAMTGSICPYTQKIKVSMDVFPPPFQSSGSSTILFSYTHSPFTL